MTGTVFVTDAQVKAAQMLVDRDRARGREPDLATLKIAGARQGVPVRSTPASPGTPPPASVSFWDALDPAEREALGSAASWLTFPAGKALMRQGEVADEVIVILGGRVKISVDRDGRENILAVRGLGQLVGEGAAFRPSERSATVTALEMVWALVITSEDFAAFVESHPRVTSILYDQLYDRLVEDRAAYCVGEGDRDRLTGTFIDSAMRPGPVYDESADEYLHRHLASQTGENCAVVLSDVAGLSAWARDDHRSIRDALNNMLAAALPGGPGIRTLDRGDGFLTVLPPRVSIADVMSRLLEELPAAIERHNGRRDGSVPFQLRLVINVGPVSDETSGFSGEGIDLASQLLEAPHLEKAIANGAIMAVVISPFVFETVIRPGPDLNKVASYTPIPVEIGEFSTTAWMKVVSGDPIAGNAQA